MPLPPDPKVNGDEGGAGLAADDMNELLGLLAPVAGIEKLNPPPADPALDGLGIPPTPFEGVPKVKDDVGG